MNAKDLKTMEFWGLTHDEIAVAVWEENITVVNVFESISTQWRAGPSGVIGLDYLTVPMAMQMLGIKRKRLGEVLDGVRVMERAALKQIYGD